MRKVAQAITRTSVDDKLARYLLNYANPANRGKAKYFEEVLGFTKANADDLARQIVFNSKTAVQTGITQYGTKFNQIITLIGANGRKSEVLFGWIKNKDGFIRLVTGFPAK